MTTLFVGLFAGLVGMAYFMYGKREAKLSALLCGTAMCIYPYFVASLLWQIVLGVVLAAVPFFVEF